MDNLKNQFRNNRKEEIRKEVEQSVGVDQRSHEISHDTPVLRQTIKLKKRKQRRKLLRKLKILAVVLVLLAVFLFSPLFRIRAVTVQGIEHAGRQKLETAAMAMKGKHILFYGKKDLQALQKGDPFVKSIDAKADIKGDLLVTIEEHPADYALSDSGSVHILTREGRILGSRVVIPPGATLLLDSATVLAPGNMMYGEGPKKDFLILYKELMAQNTSLIDFDRIDLKDPERIILHSGGWLVEIGEGKDLERKLNQAINILKTVGNQEPGIIDLKFNAPPVIRQRGGI